MSRRPAPPSPDDQLWPDDMPSDSPSDSPRDSPSDSPRDDWPSSPVDSVVRVLARGQMSGSQRLPYVNRTAAAASAHDRSQRRQGLVRRQARGEAPVERTDELPRLLRAYAWAAATPGAGVLASDVARMPLVRQAVARRYHEHAEELRRTGFGDERDVAAHLALDPEPWDALDALVFGETCWPTEPHILRNLVLNRHVEALRPLLRSAAIAGCDDLPERLLPLVRRDPAMLEMLMTDDRRFRPR